VSLHSAPSNIVLFLIDDLGWRDLGCQGSTFYQTPHIDRLAGEGARFTDAYAACAVCSPTRAAIITGRYGFRNGVGHPNSGTLPSSEITLPELFTAQSSPYQLASFGKWHLGGGATGPEDTYWFVTCPSFVSTSIQVSTCGGATWDTALAFLTSTGGNISSAGITNGATCNDDGGLSGCATGLQSQVMAYLNPGTYLGYEIRGSLHYDLGKDFGLVAHAVHQGSWVVWGQTAGLVALRYGRRGTTLPAPSAAFASGVHGPPLLEAANCGLDWKEGAK